MGMSGPVMHLYNTVIIFVHLVTKSEHKHGKYSAVHEDDRGRSYVNHDELENIIERDKEKLEVNNEKGSDYANSIENEIHANFASSDEYTEAEMPVIVSSGVLEDGSDYANSIENGIDDNL
eukprot:TRINITY_DN16868_c0_g1_i1.p1 TRINITY_DN16868_c0_g1~~TRINITY_DN16868_c0_g1_i1.p1  ORF type:complete len:129 (-),score=34.04 TRINITY_DN16868_c0_g1_i1:184-546(-)